MTRKLLAAIALVALLIGAVAAPAGAKRRSKRHKPRSTPAWTTSKAAPKGETGGEPSIAVGPEGNLYVSYPADKGPLFYRSLDDGRTWLAGPTVDTDSGDTTISTDAAGSVYETNLRYPGADPQMLQIDVYKSRDAGVSFPQQGRNSLTGLTPTSNPFFVDRQWFDAWIPPGKTTDEARAYIGYHDFGPNAIWVNASKDGGRTFGPPVSVLSSPAAQAASFCDTIPGGVKVVPRGRHAGRVYVAWLAGDLATNAATGCNVTQLNTFHTVWIAWSDDGGRTWTDQLVHDGRFGHDAGALFADLTLDHEGNPYIAYAENLTEQWDVYVSASFDGGRTWNGYTDGSGEPYKVTSDEGTHFFPAIAAGEPGKVDVVYLGTDKVVDMLPYGKPAPGGGEGASWRVYQSQSLDLASGRPTWTTQAISPVVHVGDVCTLGIFCTVGEPFGADRDLLDFIDIAIDRSGRAKVAYTADAKELSGIIVALQRAGTTLVTPPTRARARRHCHRRGHRRSCHRHRSSHRDRPR